MDARSHPQRRPERVATAIECGSETPGRELNLKPSCAGDRISRDLPGRRPDRRTAYNRELLGRNYAAPSDHPVDSRRRSRIGFAKIAQEILPEPFAVTVLLQIEQRLALRQERNRKAADRRLGTGYALTRCLCG
jgi:hypothetical protein